jgi:RimJ/RimL family protein N-acetyltransferase
MSFITVTTGRNRLHTGRIRTVTVGPFPYPLTLTGDGVILREWHSDDLDDLVTMLDEPDIARWTPMPSPFDVEAGIAYLKRAYQGRISGRRIQLAITVDGAAPLGEILLFGVGTGPKEAELGYLIGEPHRRRGLASSALSLLSTYAQSTLGLSRLVLRIDPANTSSTSVARRCGYRLTGEAPILQEGPWGPTSLDTWELLEGQAGTRLERLRNVAARRYGRRT